MAEDLTWIRTARVFLVDAYQPPFAPELEYDAQALAQTMSEMHANTVRISTMGKYATVQGVRFSTHPDLGKRDILAETIAAAKPRGIRVVPYISDRPQARLGPWSRAITRSTRSARGPAAAPVAITCT